MTEQSLPDFTDPVEGIDEDLVQEFAREWNKGGYVDIEGRSLSLEDLEDDGWIHESRRVLWTLKTIGRLPASPAMSVISEVPMWLSTLVAHAINTMCDDENWERCGPCSALQNMPIPLRRKCAEQYIEQTGDHIWWNSAPKYFKSGVFPWELDQITGLDLVGTESGPCGFCGGADARHRVYDAIAGRLMAGEDEYELALDYNLSQQVVNKIGKEVGVKNE